MSNYESSKYTQYLPRIFQTGNNKDGDFLGRLLKSFEQILSGKTEMQETRGIEEILDDFDMYLDPDQTPPQFLEWLAGWVALDLEDGIEFFGAEDTAGKNANQVQILPLPEKRTSVNREMIGAIVQLYKKRGTCDGLLEYLQLYTGEETTISINEFQDTARIGESREIGRNTMVGSSSPSFFCVNAMIPAHSKSMLENKVGLIRRVIEDEKPFYTNYRLNVEIPEMRVGVYSKVGKETLLGGMIDE
ncbi:tail protein [Ruminiclostridium cellulolyticum]|uniref:Phage tail protein n=1 Tax=Ruminiclostridium cellulolyticum (strain ATCC 35319 / DSM 5812 / JCM 6584 / H10) TaxID=394503 RepID=B8I240_RUMCH|nr:tail protein [Ruminiclostridium cellulolyticum]ACL75866.1 phage tail protein [Ruminiclostridium cellulolyticum H10]